VARPAGKGVAVTGPVYLDCNATTPLEPAVAEVVRRFMEEEYGNAASTVHRFGTAAHDAVERARAEVASVVGARADEVVFTSGATEANNLALLGLASFGEASGRRHVVASRLEHKAVLEPLEQLAARGFSVDLIGAGADGRVSVEALKKVLRPDTLLVSVMQANNETGIVQPLEEIASLIQGHPAFFHTDAAQGFGKAISPLAMPRLDMISVSGHKIYGPKGIGALILRRRDGALPPLRPLTFGGGQERGLRPGTLPVPLIAGLGEAARLALACHAERAAYCLAFRERALTALAPLRPVINGDPDFSLPHALNVALPRIPAEVAIEALKELVAISSTSACISRAKDTSHVLAAMGVPRPKAACSVRLAWSHLTPEPDWERVVAVLRKLQG